MGYRKRLAELKRRARSVRKWLWQRRPVLRRIEKIAGSIIRIGSALKTIYDVGNLLGFW